MKQKQGLVVLALMMAFMLIVGCAQDAGPSPASPEQAEQPEGNQSGGDNQTQGGADGEVTKFTVFIPDPSAQKAPPDSPVHAQVRELYGVEFEWIIPATDPTERLGIMLAANESELPDLICFDSEPLMNQYIAAGKLLNLDEPLRQYAPELIDVNFSEFYDRLMEDDGSVYYLPRYYSIEASKNHFVENTNCLWLKSEYFDETDSWDRVPLATLDDVTTLLQDLKAYYPGQYPMALALGSNGNLDDIITFGAGSAGLYEAAHIVMNKDGSLSYLFENENCKAFFKWLNSLNQQELLDIESPLLSIDSLKEKIVNGQAYSSLAWRYGTLRGPYISYQQSQGYSDRIMFTNYPVLNSSVTEKTFTRGGMNMYSTGLTATVNMKNMEKFMEFYKEANTERGHFNVLGITNWDFEGENSPEETEGYNFIVMKEPNETGKRPILWTEWTWEMWDENEDWAWQWGVENLVEFTYNAETTLPNAEFDIFEAMRELPPDEEDTLSMKFFEVDSRLGMAGTPMAYWEFMNSMWVDTTFITNLSLSDDDQAIRNALKVVYDRQLPRVIMAADDAAFEQEWAALLSELESSGYKDYMSSVQTAYDARVADWG